MLTNTNRILIYASKKPDELLIKYLNEHGWDVHLTKSSNNLARQIKASCSTSAALLDLGSGYSTREIHELESVMQPSHIGWVALVCPEQLGDAPTRHLIRDYCFDYVIAPYQAESFCKIIGHAYGMAALTDTISPPQPILSSNGEMIGTCTAMQELFRVILKISRTDAPVFIFGESGTGKELTAVAIHERSLRNKGPFVAINCGAIQQNLMQSELFGYERGAFTGANQRKIGRVEAANGGTLFLDEIGDLPLESQAGLLRFLQQGTVDRLGGHESIKVDVRVISATNVNLEEAAKEGRFRVDLFHRLCVLRVEEPPLRARGADIEILAHYVLQRYKAENRRKIRGFTRCAIRAMHTYEWPGNVREMINRVRRAIVMSDGKTISAKDLDLSRWADERSKTLEEMRSTAERQAIEHALLRHNNRYAAVAEELGISRITLYRMMGKHGLRAPDACSIQI
jgi:DNA-binding NtrC family response regulator